MPVPVMGCGLLTGSAVRRPLLVRVRGCRTRRAPSALSLAGLVLARPGGAGKRLDPDDVRVSRVGRKDLAPGALAPGPVPVDADALHCQLLNHSPCAGSGQALAGAAHGRSRGAGGGSAPERNFGGFFRQMSNAGTGSGAGPAVGRQPQGELKVGPAGSGAQVDAGQLGDPVEPVVQRGAVQAQRLGGRGDVAAQVRPVMSPPRARCPLAGSKGFDKCRKSAVKFRAAAEAFRAAAWLRSRYSTASAQE
jgi:hypothetical protein